MNMKFTLLLATAMVLCGFSIEKAKAQVITPEEMKKRRLEANENKGEKNPFSRDRFLISK